MTSSVESGCKPAAVSSQQHRNHFDSCMNLLRKIDSNIVDVDLQLISFVALYILEQSTSNNCVHDGQVSWSRADVEGFLYVAKRSCEPKNVFIVVNQRRKRNFVDFVERSWEINTEPNFLFYRRSRRRASLPGAGSTTSRVFGVWFFDDAQRNRVQESLVSIIKSLWSPATLSVEMRERRNSQVQGHTDETEDASEIINATSSEELDLLNLLQRGPKGVWPPCQNVHGADAGSISRGQAILNLIKNGRDATSAEGTETPRMSLASSQLTHLTRLASIANIPVTDLLTGLTPEVVHHLTSSPALKGNLRAAAAAAATMAAISRHLNASKGEEGQLPQTVITTTPFPEPKEDCCISSDGPDDGSRALSGVAVSDYHPSQQQCHDSARLLPIALIPPKIASDGDKRLSTLSPLQGNAAAASLTIASQQQQRRLPKMIVQIPSSEEGASTSASGECQAEASAVTPTSLFPRDKIVRTTRWSSYSPPVRDQHGRCNCNYCPMQRHQHQRLHHQQQPRVKTPLARRVQEPQRLTSGPSALADFRPQQKMIQQQHLQRDGHGIIVHSWRWRATLDGGMRQQQPHRLLPVICGTPPSQAAFWDSPDLL